MKAEESDYQTQECVTTQCPAHWLWGLCLCQGISSCYLETRITNNSPATQRNVVSLYKCFGISPSQLLCVRVLY